MAEAAKHLLWTAQTFLEWANRPENMHQAVELWEGTIVEMAPSPKINTVVAMRLGGLMTFHPTAQAEGYVTGPDGGFQINPTTVFQPDVAYIRKTRAGGLAGGVFPVAPDIAAEVISRSERYVRVMNKVGLYLEGGTQLVWAIYPEQRYILVFQLSENKVTTATLHDDQTLSGAPILPEFRVPVRDIFPPPDEITER